MNNELYHHGIKGMRWGIRRYQNKDGSLTPAGKRRVSQLDAEREALVGTKAKTENKPKTFREMSTDELREQINRRRMEKEYLELNKQVSDLAPAEVSLGKRIFSHLASKVIVPAATDAGKKFLTDFLNKEGAKALGLGKDTEVAKPLKDVVADLNLKKQKIELDKYFESYKQEQAAKTKKSKPDDSSKKSNTESKDTKSEKTKTSDTPSNEPKKETANEAKTSTQNKSSEPKTKQKTEKTETYTGEVFGEGTSHKTFTENEAKRKDSGTIYTYDFTDKSTSDPAVERSIVLGRQYVAGLLEEKKR